MDFSNTRFNWAFITALLAIFASFSGATSRELQVEQTGEICYCAPNTYEFILDFKLTCPPVNITLGDAVAATTCMVSPYGAAEVADLVPVEVSSIDVLELNQNLQVMVQETIVPTSGVYLDGDTFSYVSYAAIPGEAVKPEDLPRAIQLNIIGKNKNGEEIINVYLITFTNSCGAYPVLYEGQWAGWTRFKDLGPPDVDLCPLVPTPPPTMPPTPPPIAMSMSMSMDMGGLENYSIEDLLGGDLEYKEYGKGKGKGKGKGGSKDGKSKDGRKSHKSKGSGKAGKSESQKLGKPNSKDGKSKDGKGAKSGKPIKIYETFGKAKGKGSKGGKSKDGSKSGSKDGSKSGSKSGSKDGSKDGKGGKSGSHKNSNKLTKPGSKDGKSKDGSKGGSKDGSKGGSKDGSKGSKSKDGSKGGKSDSHKTANKLTKPGSKDGGKDGGKAGKPDKIYETYGKAKDGSKGSKSKDGSKAGSKAGKSSSYEENSRKEASESKKSSNKLADKSKGKGERRMRLRI